MAQAQVHTQAQAKISADDIILNRQINFWVMRRLWQVIRGRAKKGQGDNSIYKAFSMSRERYTRAINGEAIRLSKEELETLIKETGMSKGIFEGTTCFDFKDILRSEWKQLFELRNMVQLEEVGENTQDRKRLREQEKYVYGHISAKDYTNVVDNTDLCHFVAYLGRIGKPTGDKIVEDVLQKVKSISFEQWQCCDDKKLHEYKNILIAQLDMANTMIQYRKYTNTHT